MKNMVSALFLIFLSSNALANSNKLVEHAQMDGIRVGEVVENHTLVAMVLKGSIQRNGSFVSNDVRSVVALPMAGERTQLIGSEEQTVPFRLKIKRLFQRVVIDDTGKEHFRPVFVEFQVEDVSELQFRFVALDLLKQLLLIRSPEDFKANCGERSDRCPFQVRLLGVTGEVEGMEYPSP